VSKVLLVTNDFPPMPGGCARYYERLCAQAPPDSLEVLAPDLPGAGEVDVRLPVPVHRRRVPTSPRAPARCLQCLLLAWHAGRLLRRGRFVAVHLGHLYQLPVGVLLRRLFGVRYAVYLHGGEVPGLLRWGPVRRLFWRWLRGAAAVAVNSEYTRRHFLGLGFELPTTVVLPPTVDPDRFRPPEGTRDRVRWELGLDSQFVALSVGRLVPRKAHDLLLRAVAHLRRQGVPVAAVVVGEGPQRPALEALARELGIEDAVRFVGFVPDEALPRYYAAADAFVLPSRHLPQRDGVEGFGIVFLEAGAVGLPVVGTWTGGIPEAVEHGRTGLLVPPDDVEALAQALRTLAWDSERARRLGDEGKRRASQGAQEQVLRLWHASGWAPPMRKAPRVLHVITRLVVGGAQENTLLTVRGLQSLGYEVELAVGPETGPEGSLAVPEGTVVHWIPSLVREIRPLADARALWALYRIMRRGYDVVHTHTSKAGVLGRIAARWASVPLVVHTPHGHVYHGYGGRLRSRLFVWVERLLAGWTDALVALTESERQDHLREGVGRPERWHVIPSGVEIERYQRPSPLRRRDVGLPEDAFVVGCVARLVPVKGIEDAIEATARLTDLSPPVHLVLVGDGPQRPALERRVEERGLGGRVHFLGLRRDVPDLLPLFDLVVLPSRNEGMGRAIVEAQAAGVPVVATRVGGIPDLVAHGETGVLVPPADPAALATAIRSLAEDGGTWARMKAAARVRVARDLSAEAMVRALDALYRHAAGRERPGERRGGRRPPPAKPQEAAINAPRTREPREPGGSPRSALPSGTGSGR
jgi:glycosyltransferase involved in cell wall biosynthesis